MDQKTEEKGNEIQSILQTLQGEDDPDILLTSMADHHTLVTLFNSLSTAPREITNKKTGNPIYSKYDSEFQPFKVIVY
jgi:hypothetical protein